MANTITTQQVVNALLAYGRKHGSFPGEWRLMIAGIRDEEATVRQLLYRLFNRMEQLADRRATVAQRNADPEILLYATTLKDFGVAFVAR